MNTTINFNYKQKKWNIIRIKKTKKKHLKQNSLFFQNEYKYLIRSF